MKALQLIAKEQLEFVELPNPRIADNEVMLKMKKVGICGTDLHLYKSEVKNPIVLGHEFVGTVEAVGSKVKNVSVGERATAEHVKSCGKCFYCQTGKRNLCLNREIYGLTRTGALAEYLALPAELVYPLPDELDFDAGVLVEPLSIAMYGARKADVGLGNTVAVVGQGPIGLFVDQVCRETGAEVYGFDINQARLDYAHKHDLAHAVINTHQEDAPASFKRKSGQDGADVVFEVVGQEATTHLALDLARPGAKVVILGIFEHDIMINMTQVVRNELELIGSYTCMNVFGPTISLLSRGTVQTKQFITHRYPFDQAAQAFKDALNYTEARIKTVIEF